MSLFGKVVRMLVNTAALPVEVVRDVLTLGGVATGEDKSYTIQRLETLKEEAEDD
jgi:hypothetical protein